LGVPVNITASAWCSALLTESWVWAWSGGEQEELRSYFFYNSTGGLLKRQDPQIALTDIIALVRGMQTQFNRAESLTQFVHNFLST